MPVFYFIQDHLFLLTQKKLSTKHHFLTLPMNLQTYSFLLFFKSEEFENFFKKQSISFYTSKSLKFNVIMGFLFVFLQNVGVAVSWQIGRYSNVLRNRLSWKVEQPREHSFCTYMDTSCLLYIFFFFSNSDIGGSEMLSYSLLFSTVNHNYQL